MKLKTSSIPTQIWSFGTPPPKFWSPGPSTSEERPRYRRLGEPPIPLAQFTGEPFVREVLFRGNRFYNDRIALERTRYAEYVRIRRSFSPALAACEDAYVAADVAAQKAVQDIKDARAKQYRQSKKKSDEVPAALIEALRVARAQQKETKTQLKRARAHFEAQMKPTRLEYDTRCQTRKLALASKSGITSPHYKGRVNREVLREMVAETQWPQAWKDLQSMEAAKVRQQKVVRKQRPVGAGIGGLIEKATNQAVKMSKFGPPGFSRFECDGRVGGQINPPCSMRDLFTGKNSKIRLRPQAPKLKRKHNLNHGKWKFDNQFFILALNIGTEVRNQAKWIEVPVRIHRPLPPDGKITQAWLLVRRQGPKLRYSVQLSIESESFLLPKKMNNGRERPIGVGRVAVNFGWRMVPGGVRAAYWTSETGERDELVLGSAEQEIFYRLTHPDVLRKHADEHFNEVRRVVRRYLRSGGGARISKTPTVAETGNRLTHWDRWARKDEDSQRRQFTSLLWQWAKFRIGKARLDALWHEWKGYRLAHTEARPDGLDLFAHRNVASEWAKEHGLTQASERLAWWCHLWVRKEIHLAKYEADLRFGSHNQRDAIYRTLALKLSTQFGELITDNTKFSDLARREKVGDEGTEAWEKARKNRQAVGAGRFRAIFRDVFGQRGIVVSAVDNSVICSRCRQKMNVVAGESEVQCKQCGPIDVDHNNCLNMLRRADDGERITRDQKEDAPPEQPSTPGPENEQSTGPADSYTHDSLWDAAE